MYVNCTQKIEYAKYYADLGFHVFPVHAIESDGGCTCGRNDCKDVAKHPLTANGFKGATTDPEKLKEYFSGEYDIANIGLATGPVSGVWVLDVDDIGSLKKLEHKHGTLPRTPTGRTGRGLHYFLKSPDGRTISNSNGKVADGIDVRGDGGYVILPPSNHKSGKQYQWVVSPDETTIADAPDWLVELATSSSSPTPSPSSTSSQTSSQTVARSTSLTIGGAVTTNERVTLYLAKTPPAIAGERGHDRTLGVVCKLFELFDIANDNDILSLLADWNSRCSPPWTEKELRHKIDSARIKVSSQVADDNVDDDEWPVLDEDALYGLSGEYVQTTLPVSECDPVALQLTFLTAFGSLIGRNANYPVDGGEHHTNLFACVVGSSSRARKGTSLGHVRQVFKGIDPDWRQISGLSSGEGIINALRDETITDDNGKFVVGGGVPDKRLWVIETEFGQTLRVLKREQNTLSPVLRNAWDRGELSVLTRTNPLTASNVHVSILGHITRAELLKYLDDTDIFNGFSNRFLWALVKRSKLLPDGGSVSLDEFRGRLKNVTQIATSITTMTRSDSAKSLWWKVYEGLVSEKVGLWDAVTSRAEAQVLRLSMIYALLDGSSTIDEQHLRAALALWRYCDDSARIIFGTEEGSTVERKIQRVVKDQPGILKSELRNAISHKLKASEFTRSLNWLVKRGGIVCVPVHESCKPAERYYPPVQGQGHLLSRTINSVNSVAPNSKCPVVDTDKMPPSKCPALVDRRTPQIKRPVPDNVQAASLADMFDWINVNSATVHVRDDKVWVTNADRLTPALEAALNVHREALMLLVDDDEKPMDADEFEKELRDALTI